MVPVIHSVLITWKQSSVCVYVCVCVCWYGYDGIICVCLWRGPPSDEYGRKVNLANVKMISSHLFIGYHFRTFIARAGGGGGWGKKGDVIHRSLYAAIDTLLI